MPITAALSRTLHDALGDEAAADLVDWMQTVDSNRAGLRELNELMYARFDSRFNEQRQATDALRAELRHELRAEISTLRMEMHDGFAGVKVALAESRAAAASAESKSERRFADLLKWSFLFWCGAFAAAALTRWAR